MHVTDVAASGFCHTFVLTGFAGPRNAPDMKSFREVIGRWPTAPVLAEQIGEEPHTVRQWKARNLIPARKLQKVAEAAERAGFTDITFALLTELYKLAKAEAA
ncbi:MAG: hypothetical protein KKA05_10525 [Alphaproteobacteria bacterium]|nr:hypothetical protein [Alphaproteobacteria bacterium]